jgi:predicted site-specific integrase-resolvase
MIWRHAEIVTLGRTPLHFSKELIEDARILLGARLGGELSAEEARQMLVRLTTYFETLIEWRSESLRQAAGRPAPSALTATGRPPAALYARVSSKEQEKEGFSIPAQLRLLREYASRHGLTIVREFVDIETAKKSGRTNFESMLTFFRRHRSCRTLLVEQTDRLYRNLKDSVSIDELDLALHFVKENVALSPDSKSVEKFMHGIKVLMAKKYGPARLDSCTRLRRVISKVARARDQSGCVSVGPRIGGDETCRSDGEQSGRLRHAASTAARAGSKAGPYWRRRGDCVESHAEEWVDHILPLSRLSTCNGI